MPSSIAFFDVDHTLVDGNSGYYSSIRLVRRGVLKRRRVLQAVYYSLASLLFPQDVKKIYQIAIDDMAGWPLDKILEIGNECFEKDIKKRLFPDGLKKIKEHQKRGDRVVLLSSGPYMTLYHLRAYLKADTAYTMGPIIEGGVLTDTLHLPICHAEGKIHFAELEARKHHVPLKKCFFYTDHISDIPLLEKVGHPVVVNPNRKLARFAEKHGWKILRWS